MDPYLNDWLDFLFRWLHVVAGIVWIGTSFYFVALDNHLHPPEDRRNEEGVGGESWEIHGGGFYRIQKFRVAPRRLPEPLHWFKWEAYTTWLSGFALLIVLYYFQADTYLIDRSVADLEEWEAIAISVALLAAAWVVYDALCRLLAARGLALAAAIGALVTLSAWGLGNLFGARAAFIQLGAMLGTIMVANVFFVIMPGQRELVRAKKEGREPDAAPGIRAKQRSVHNNYLTLPVVLAMLSPHFPVAIGHEHAWAVIASLMAVGAWIRHYFNLRHRGLNVWPIPVSAGVALVAIALAIKPDDDPARAAPAGSVDFARVQEIVAERCAPCHSARPTQPGFSAAPGGVELDTPEQIAAQAEAIEQQAVDTTAMPLGNVTGMTDEERAELAAWLSAGAPTR